MIFCSVKNVKLRRTNHGLNIHFELNDGTEIIRSEERLLKNLGDSAVLAGFKKFQIEACVKN